MQWPETGRHAGRLYWKPRSATEGSASEEKAEFLRPANVVACCGCGYICHCKLHSYVTSS